MRKLTVDGKMVVLRVSCGSEFVAFFKQFFTSRQESAG
jgi:hypothetical protein